MRMIVTAALAAIACFAVAGQADAKIKVKTSTKTYSISGSTGEQLLEQMDRKGPKHGFLTRAIAQTRYSITWDIAWESNGRGCRVSGVDAALDITYSYPRVSSKMSPALRKKWAIFVRGVTKHEEMHGAIAKRMVKAAEKSITGMSFKNDPRCRASRAEAKRRIAAAYAKYEAQQVAFDEKEHRDDGNVASLVERLIR